MSEVLHDRVFVLNRVFQLVNETPVHAAIIKLAADAFTALDFVSYDFYIPVKWEDWVKLPMMPGYKPIRTARGEIRAPTVVVCCEYAKVPKRRPKFTLRNIARRDQYTDQYTGELLTDPETWSLDHVIPRSRGGLDVPENVVLCHKRTNNLKSDRTPAEAGLPWPKIRRLGIFDPIPANDHQRFVAQWNS